jgi:hypothetical protein
VASLVIEDALRGQRKIDIIHNKLYFFHPLANLPDGCDLAAESTGANLG